MKQLVEKRRNLQKYTVFRKGKIRRNFMLGDLYISHIWLRVFQRNRSRIRIISIPVIASATKGHVDLIENEIKRIATHTPDDFRRFYCKSAHVLLSNQATAKIDFKKWWGFFNGYFEENAPKHIFHYYKKLFQMIWAKSNSENFNEA